jgi:hypothetical protein
MGSLRSLRECRRRYDVWVEEIFDVRYLDARPEKVRKVYRCYSNYLVPQEKREQAEEKKIGKPFERLTADEIGFLGPSVICLTWGHHINDWTIE